MTLEERIREALERRANEGLYVSVGEAAPDIARALKAVKTRLRNIITSRYCGWLDVREAREIEDAFIAALREDR